MQPDFGQTQAPRRLPEFLDDLVSREQLVLADYDSGNVLLLCCLQLMMARLGVCVLLHTL